jgi:hypothetical protein
MNAFGRRAEAFAQTCGLGRGEAKDGTIGSGLSARILPLAAAAPNTPQVAVMCQPRR